MKAVDVHGFGGGFTLGTVQAGFELIGKMSLEAGFGVYSTLANRHLLGHGWESLVGQPPSGNMASAPMAWDVMDADYVFGNPPCSGFSTLSRKDFRGVNAEINNCMWQLVDYAAKVAPPIVAWESVQQTFRQGLELMRRLHDHLEEHTGQRYTLYHVLHNNASVGGASNRKRYFWVAARDDVDFGVDWNRVSRTGKILPPSAPPSFGDILLDLEPLGLTMAAQPYTGVKIHHRHKNGTRHCTSKCKTEVLYTSEWCRREMHDGTGMVDGHQIAHSPTYDRIQNVFAVEPWGQGESMASVMRRYYNRTKSFPRGFDYNTTKVDPEDHTKRIVLKKSDRLLETDFAMGHNQPFRWKADEPARVITGGGVHLVVHPYQPRTLTQRETARVQGFPDDWKIWPIRFAADLGPAWGKGVPVQAGRWISKWAYESLHGRPGPMTGVPLEKHDKKLGEKFGPREREFVIDITRNWEQLTTASS